jgi:hypothetical protein
MKRVLVIAALCAGVAGTAWAEDKAALVEEGKALIQQFGGTLKTELQTAIKAKGAPYAIEVCNLRAPEIAAQVSSDSGWSVARSSHKLRNPQDNAADAYTAAVIDEFLTRQAAGESAETLAKAEIVEIDGQKQFRLVKAIPTAEVCLACHGSAEVSPEVEVELARLYPEDQARGFSEGEMRGVFTLMKPLN